MIHSLHELLSQWVAPQTLSLLVGLSAGLVFGEVFRLGMLLAMKAFDVSMSRRGDIVSNRHVLTETEVGDVLRAFTPSSLIGLDVRSGTEAFVSV